MKTVLITGAYRGLGYEVARQLSERDWKVIVSARRRDQCSAAAAKLKNSSFLELDITEDSSVARAAKEVLELDVLINNAAVIIEGDQDILTIRPKWLPAPSPPMHWERCAFRRRSCRICSRAPPAGSSTYPAGPASSTTWEPGPRLTLLRRRA